MDEINSVYRSPFSWRYGSTQMRQIWSEYHKRLLWRKLWVILAETQAEFGLVNDVQVQDLKDHAHQVDIQRALEIESEIHHDLMAEIKVFAEQCPVGGGIIHLGATSMDIKDNADALRVHQALLVIEKSLRNLLMILQERVEAFAGLPIIAFTHLQPAEPTTLGYRLAQYAQDLLEDYQDLQRIIRDLCIKGFRGAVGNSAAFQDLIGEDRLEEFHKRLTEKLGLPIFDVVTQVYPRKQDYRVASVLAGIGASLHRLALDWRILQSMPIGEWSEPFDEKQVGSSAMPFKRNPINAEKIDSLAKMLAQYPRLAWDNAANSIMENTLDDSANRRTMLPEMFLICDELLITSQRLLKGLIIYQEVIQKNLHQYAPFAATERVMVAAAKSGLDRQLIHEELRQLSMQAWQEVKNGKSNPLQNLLLQDELIRSVLSEGEIRRLMDIEKYVGDAALRAHKLSERIRQICQEGK
ncbi:MAG: adenylosuccinate lyase [Anaerolineales bacterium]